MRLIETDWARRMCVASFDSIRASSFFLAQLAEQSCESSESESAVCLLMSRRQHAVSWFVIFLQEMMIRYQIGTCDVYERVGVRVPPKNPVAARDLNTRMFQAMQFQCCHSIVLVGPWDPRVSTDRIRIDYGCRIKRIIKIWSTLFDSQRIE